MLMKNVVSHSWIIFVKYVFLSCVSYCTLLFTQQDSIARCALNAVTLLFNRLVTKHYSTLHSCTIGKRKCTYFVLINFFKQWSYWHLCINSCINQAFPSLLSLHKTEDNHQEKLIRDKGGKSCLWSWSCYWFVCIQMYILLWISVSSTCRHHCHWGVSTLQGCIVWCGL